MEYSAEGANDVESALEEILTAYEEGHYRENQIFSGDHRAIIQPELGSGRVLLWDSKGAGGSLIHNPEHYKPSEQGALVYFTSRTGDINDELSRVESAGGEILRAKTQISEDHGYMALFKDTEGNRVALHSLK